MDSGKFFDEMNSADGKVQLSEDDNYLNQIRDYWGSALNQAFKDMPDPNWLKLGPLDAA